MDSFLDRVEKRPLCFDGATGTMIQKLGLDEVCYGGADFKMLVDILCFSMPETVRDIHASFYRAGADTVETNTFGASPLRLGEYDFSALDSAAFSSLPAGFDLHAADAKTFAYHLNCRAASIAREARELYRHEKGYDGRPLYVAGSIGPSNYVVSASTANLRHAGFDEISENFYFQCLGLLDGGVDVLLFETQQDILELKAGIFGAHRAMRERNMRVPIMAQVTVDSFGRMQLFNTDIHAALVTVQGTGIDVFGINCSIGPDLMEKTVEKICRFSSLPVSVVPNAGLPVSENGETVFRFDPDRFASYLERFVVEYGVSIVGGCCGTTPEHIAAVKETIKNAVPSRRNPDTRRYVSGPQRAVCLDDNANLIRVGERLNIRGSKKVREAVENETGINHDTLEAVAREQTHGLGCEIIDVCMDSNIVDTTAALCEVVHRQTTDFGGALCLDSFQFDALAAAIKMYPGRPILNSISYEEIAPGRLKMDALIEATRAHDPFYVALCTGPEGPAATAQAKLELAQRIIDRARDKHRLPPDRLLMDVNVFPIGSENSPDANFAMETLEGIRLVKQRHPQTLTILGVGNLTNGLASKPYMRVVLTSVFLDEARKRGLDAAIVNPNHYVFVEDLDQEHYELGRRIILERDMDAFETLEVIAAAKRGKAPQKKADYEHLDVDIAITEKIKAGYKERAPGSFEFRGYSYGYEDRIVLQAAQALEHWEPLDFVNERLMAAMKELGDGFAKGEVSLPHLLRSADVMRQVMGFIEQYLANHSGSRQKSERRHKGVVVLGTVYQDVHSIGKDLACTLLENYGYHVVDLGVMTPLQQFLNAAVEHRADAIGVSALLVQTSNHMITLAKMMAEQGVDVPLLIGGAPVSERHAAYVALAGHDDMEKMRGNVFYCRTAMDGVNVMNKLTGAGDAAAYCELNRRALIRKYEQAQRRLEKESRLFETLPRRKVAPPPHVPHEVAYFRSKKYVCSLEELAAVMDKRTLFALNWRFGGPSGRERRGHSDAEMEALFERWTAQAEAGGWIRPQGVAGLFPCRSDGEQVVIFNPDRPGEEIARLEFASVLGAGNEDIVSGAQYFASDTAGGFDLIGLQIASAGAQVEEVIENFKNRDDYESALFLQGLSDRVAEDMAGRIHQNLRNLVGVADDCGQRWSPGYPGMKNIMHNITICDVLRADEL
ncbi:MAG TPA: 5-methyltetrahydrofolate--homocysteine methyltransferase, partial [Candidatus Hydrogenedentes bacterium]|nr:5-methyltetrahydrofolate--homocysteine methyltransferase [Candidatus Hydrogenedentota bacterium]